MKTKLLRSTLLFNVLPAVLLLLMSLLLPACEEKNQDDPEPGPRTEVPGRVTGRWSAGGFSMGEFWQYNGAYSGNAFELGIAFDFKPDGRCEFYLVTGGTSYGCRTEAFVYKKGTVAFHADSFTFHPAEGNSRGFYKGCASSYQNYNKPTPKEDLKPETYYYSVTKDSNGKDQLTIRFEPGQGAGTTFQPASW